MRPRIRFDLRRMFDAAICAVDGRVATRAALSGLPIESAGRVWVLGAGKAAANMARGAFDALGSRIDGGLVIVPDPVPPIGKIAVRVAGHPVPDRRGVDATAEILEIAAGLCEDDVVIWLVSGGGSALLVAPKPGFKLEDIVAETQRNLRDGTPIGTLNTIRRTLSAVKGGGLEDRLLPAHLISLAISDVPTDDPSIIASGPTRNARIIAHLGMALEAAATAAQALGYPTSIGESRLCGEARDVGASLGIAPLNPGECQIWGGETTVKVTGGGRGGRSQELALAAALSIEDDRILLAAGTDGIDGPTDAAGAIVDASTAIDRERARAHLADNDAWTYLKSTNDLLVTGPTGTNVADLVIMARPVPPR